MYHSCLHLILLSIHPFDDNNGRMSRFLTLLLLYGRGYTVGKYVSVENELESILKKLQEEGFAEKIDAARSTAYRMAI